MRHVLPLVILGALAACEAPTDPAPVNLPGPSHAPAPSTWQAVELPDLGGDRTFATDVSVHGQVVGTGSDGAGTEHVLLWTAESGPMDLCPTGATHATSPAINDEGQVAFAATTPGDGWGLYLWTEGTGAVRVADLDATDLAWAWDINDSGVVVGSDNIHGFRWTPGVGLELLEDFMAVPGPTPWAVNATGEMALDTYEGAHFWSPADGLIEIPLANAVTRNLNDAGQVVVITVGATFASYRWSSAEGAVPAGPPSPASTQLYGLDWAGRAVGASATTPGQEAPIIWSEEEGTTFLPVPGGGRSFAQEISDHGWIVGFRQDTDGGYHALLWIPEEPVLPVRVEVKPESEGNPIRLRARGRLPVAVLSDASVDATSLEVGAVRLGSTPVARRGNGRPHAAPEDVDGDGLDDLVLHFQLPELVANGDLTASSTELCLTGETVEGSRVEGCDAVSVLP